MTSIIFVQPDGTENAFDYKLGGSLMEAAVAHDVPGIEAQCYGAAVCGTCHIYVDEAWLGATGDKTPWEADMLASLSLGRPNSRLACQIMVDDRLEGARFVVPEQQEALD